MTDLKKPVKRVARNLDVPHGVNPSMVITLAPGGFISLRESGRRKSVTLNVSTLYTQALLAEVRNRRLERRKARLARRRG